eukprot:Tamp_17872.p1 GENE.Tamp_17872~~Tamp_17872.p1  ORF type:complete len:426 (-),score=32.32 Tamp_17872:15-1292(-)
MLRELTLGHTGLADHSASMLASAAERTPASLTLHTCEDDHGIDSAQKVLSVLEVLIAHTTHIIGQQNTELLKTVYSNMLSLAERELTVVPATMGSITASSSTSRTSSPPLLHERELSVVPASTGSIAPCSSTSSTSSPPPPPPPPSQRPRKRQKGEQSLSAQRERAIMKVLTHTHQTVSALWDKIVKNGDGYLWVNQQGALSQSGFGHCLYMSSQQTSGRCIAAMQSTYRLLNGRSKQHASELILMEKAFFDLKRAQAHAVDGVKFSLFIVLALRALLIGLPAPSGHSVRERLPLKTVEVRPADTEEKRQRTYDGSSSEWWFLKSNLRLSTHEHDEVGTDQPVFILMHVQFWQCVHVTQLWKYESLIGGAEVYDWCIDRPADRHGTVQLWHILETCRVPVCMQHLTASELGEQHTLGLQQSTQSK